MSNKHKKIDELISELKEIKKKHGNINIFIELDEDVDCPECGEPKTNVHTGNYKFVRCINTNNFGMCAWIFGDIE